MNIQNLDNIDEIIFQLEKDEGFILDDSDFTEQLKAIRISTKPTDPDKKRLADTLFIYGRDHRVRITKHLRAAERSGMANIVEHPFYPFILEYTSRLIEYKRDVDLKDAYHAFFKSRQARRSSRGKLIRVIRNIRYMPNLSTDLLKHHSAIFLLLREAYDISENELGLIIAIWNEYFSTLQKYSLKLNSFHKEDINYLWYEEAKEKFIAQQKAPKVDKGRLVTYEVYKEQKHLAEEDQKILDLKTTILLGENENKSLTQQLRKKEREMSKLEGQIRFYEKEIKWLKQSLQNLRRRQSIKDDDEISKEIAKIRKKYSLRNKSLEDIIEMKDRAINILQEKAYPADKQTAILKQKAMSLKKASENEYKAIKNENAQLEELIIQWKRKYSQLREDYKNLESINQNSVTKAEYEHLKQENEKLAIAYQELSIENDGLREDLAQKEDFRTQVEVETHSRLESSGTATIGYENYSICILSPEWQKESIINNSLSSDFFNGLGLVKDKQCEIKIINTRDKKGRNTSIDSIANYDLIIIGANDHVMKGLPANYASAKWRIESYLKEVKEHPNVEAPKKNGKPDFSKNKLQDIVRNYILEARVNQMI